MKLQSRRRGKLLNVGENCPETQRSLVCMCVPNSHKAGLIARLTQPPARLIHGPCLVTLDQAFKRLRSRQAFVNLDHYGLVAEGECEAVVCLFIRDADRQPLASREQHPRRRG